MFSKGVKSVRFTTIFVVLSLLVRTSHGNVDAPSSSSSSSKTGILPGGRSSAVASLPSDLLSLPDGPRSISVANKASRNHDTYAEGQLQEQQQQEEEEEVLSVRELQRRTGTIASSFQPGTFRPWIKNRHVQTIGGFFLRRTCAYLPDENTAGSLAMGVVRYAAERVRDAVHHRHLDGTSKHPFWDVRERIDTPDGDWFHADIKFSPQALGVEEEEAKEHHERRRQGRSLLGCAPTVILIHGLESSSSSLVSMEMAKAYNDVGMHCVCLNFRGCSGIPNESLGGYHLGYTDDLKHYLRLLRDDVDGDGVVVPGDANSKDGRRTRRRLYLSGYSLGANVVLKCLGELGRRATDTYDVYGASVICAPLDQERNAVALAKPGINREVYSKNLLRSLQRRTREQLHQFLRGDVDTDRFHYPRAMKAKTITEYDDAVIAPLYGFDDCWDYYKQTSSVHYMERITVPTYVLNARDDPFFDPAVWPVERTCEYGGPAPIKMSRTDAGGHLGFCFHLVDKDDERLEKRAKPTPARRDAAVSAATGLDRGGGVDIDERASAWNGDDDSTGATNSLQKRKETSFHVRPAWSAVEMARFVQHVEEHPDRPDLAPLVDTTGVASSGTNTEFLTVAP